MVIDLACLSRSDVMMRSCSFLGLPSVALVISLLHLRVTAISTFSACGIMPSYNAESMLEALMVSPAFIATVID